MEQLINVVRKASHHIIIKPLKTKDKGKNLENNQKEGTICMRKIIRTSSFLIENKSQKEMT